MMKIIKILAIAVLMASGCARITEEEKAFIYMESTPQLNVRGAATIIYDKNHFQLGYNESKGRFYLTNDEGSVYYRLSCRELPVHQDQEFIADLQWNDGKKKFNKRGLRFIVLKEDRGTFWIWCRSENSGLTIKKLED